MPLLEHLEQFRSSFMNIANEAQIQSKSELPLERLELPDSDPPLPFPEGLDGTGIGKDPLNPDDLGLDLPASNFADLGADDFSDLLGSIPSSGVEFPDIDLSQDMGPGDIADTGAAAGTFGADPFGADNAFGADAFGADNAFGADAFGTDSASGTDSTSGADNTFGADNAFGADAFGTDGTFGTDSASGADNTFGADAFGTDSAFGADSGFGADTFGADDTAADSTIAGGGAPTDSEFNFPDFDEGGIDLSESLDLGGEAPGSGFGVPLEDVSGKDLKARAKEPSIGPAAAPTGPESSLDGLDLSDFSTEADLSESVDLGGEAPGSGFGVPMEDVSGLGLGTDGGDSTANDSGQTGDFGFPSGNLAGTDFGADFGADLSESFDLGGEQPGSGFGVPMEDVSGMDFGAGTSTDDFGLPSGNLAGSDFGSGSTAANSASTDDFGLPVEDITGTDFGSGFGEGSDGAGSFDGTSFDSAFGLPIEDISGTDFGSGSTAANSASTDDFGLPVEDITGTDFGGGSGTDFGGGTDFGAGFDAGADSAQTSDFGFPVEDISGTDFGGGSGTDFGGGVSALDGFDGLPGFGSDAGAASFDSGSAFPDGDEPSIPEPVLDTPDFGAPAADEDFGDFSLAGFDDIPEPGKTRTGRAAPSASSDDVEEINLTDNDYKQLLETLSVYPLNLRIACEELIAEQAVAPELMSALIKLLVRGAPARETAVLAGKILGRTISIPKGYSKKTGAEMEAEQASFGYVFIHHFLPVLRIFAGIAVVAASLAYLCWTFIIVPTQAKNLYKEGYTRLQSGEYTRANELFRQAFEKRRVKKWFYTYAEGFRDERQYIFAEQKYDELLRVYPRDKKGALDYASMETYYLRNYEKADRIIRNNILDYTIDDREGLLALAENNLEWGETEPARYEDARAAYARLMEKYGRKDPYLEGMLKYFIRTDQLGEVLPLQSHFMSDPKKRKITVPTLAELGGYLLDKRFEETEGVPQEYADRIEGIRDVLLRAINEDRNYPESYYHLARYYHNYGSALEERQSLKDAIRTFDSAGKETPRRASYRIDSHRRLAESLINTKEFFPAEEELIRGVRLYEDARTRQVLKTDAMFGRLYADLGDLEFFVKDGNMEASLRFYEEAERNLWAPPEIQYRMGAAHYQLEQWEDALMRFFPLVSAMPANRRLLYALGNISYLRGNYFAAQGYYNRLMDLLDTQRVRFPDLNPDNRPEAADLTERIMVAENNLGVTLEALTRISGDTSYRSRALGLFTNSIRAWDVLTRDPETMNRMRPFSDLYGPGVNLAYLNVRSITLPQPNYDPQIFMRIDKDGMEPSAWEDLVARDYRLSDQLLPMAVE